MRPCGRCRGGGLDPAPGSFLPGTVVERAECAGTLAGGGLRSGAGGRCGTVSRLWAMAEEKAGRAHRWPYLVRHLASHLTAEERPGVLAGLLGGGRLAGGPPEVGRDQCAAGGWCAGRPEPGGGTDGARAAAGRACVEPQQGLAWPPADGLPAPGAALG